MVEEVFKDYPPSKLNRIWLYYLMNLNMVMKYHGGNKYKMPYMQKAKLERKNRLPLTLQVYLPEQDDENEEE